MKITSLKLSCFKLYLIKGQINSKTFYLKKKVNKKQVNKAAKNVKKSELINNINEIIN